MKLGFIGTGNISSDVVTGICNSKISFKKIYIAKTNQEVIDKSDWIFIGVLPKVGEKILPRLKFKSNQTVVSFISTINYLKLKKILKKKTNVVRAIPMPPIALGKGPVAIFPPHRRVKYFFDKIGDTIEIKSEKLSQNFWATSGTMASFYEIIKILSDWLVKKGLTRLQAQKYITSLYSALAELAKVNSKKDLKHFVAESQTPGGLNWQGVNELRKVGFYKSLERSINNILKRLNKK